MQPGLPVLTYQVRTLRSSDPKLYPSFSVLKAGLFEHVFEEEVQEVQA